MIHTDGRPAVAQRVEEIGKRLGDVVKIGTREHTWAMRSQGIDYCVSCGGRYQEIYLDAMGYCDPCYGDLMRRGDV